MKNETPAAVGAASVPRAIIGRSPAAAEAFPMSAPPKPGRSVIVPCLIAALLAAAWAYVLGSRLRLPGPDFSTQPIEFWDPENAYITGHAFRSWGLAFDQQESSTNGWRHIIQLAVPPPLPRPGWISDGEYHPDPRLDWSRLRSIGFYLEPTGGRIPHGREATVEIHSASLRSSEGGLEFSTDTPCRIRRGVLLELPRRTTASTNSTTPRFLELQITTTTPTPSLRLRAFLTEDPGNEAINPHGSLMKRVALPVSGGGKNAIAWPFGRITYPNQQPTTTRQELIAGWWRIAPGLHGLAGLFSLAGIGLVAGSWLMLCGGVVRCSVGVAIAFAGYGIGYALFTPPLAAVDERRHFISLLREVDAVDLLPAYIELGLRCHSTRLNYRVAEKFSSGDAVKAAEYFVMPSLYKPEAIATFVPLAADRSPAASRLWRIYGPAVHHLDPAHVVLGLRLTHLLLVAVAVGLATALWLCSAAAEPGRRLVAFAFLLIVPLPYFGMILSNYPLLLAAACILAAWIAGSMWTRNPSPWFALCGGVAAGLAFHTSRTALLLLVAIGFWWIHRIIVELLGARPKQDPATPKSMQEIWLEYGAVLGGFLLTRLITTPGYDAAIVKSLPGPLSQIDISPGLLLNLGFIGAGTGCALLEMAARRLGQNISPYVSCMGRLVIGWIARCAAVAWAMMLVATLWIAIPRTADIEYYSVYPAIVSTDISLPPAETAFAWPSPPGPKEYALRGVCSFLLSMGFGEHDHFTSRLFWSGFGFFDTVLPDAFISICCAGFSIGLVILLWTSGAATAGRAWQSASILALLATTIVGVGLLAYGCARPPDLRNLIGRYLLAQYVVLLVPAFSGWIAIGPGATRLLPFAAMIATGLHLICLATILDRYF